MSLKRVDIQRLEQLKADIDRLHLRFPITTIAQKLGTNKGNVSSYISGRVPLSDNFIEKFYTTFGEELKNVPAPHIPKGQNTEQPTTLENRLLEIIKVLNDINSCQKAVLNALNSKNEITPK